MAIALGPFLATARKRQRITQNELRDALKKRGFDYSVGNIGHWEQDRHVPPLALTNNQDETLGKVLAELLDVPIADLLAAAGFLSIDRDAHHATVRLFPYLNEWDQRFVDALVLRLLQGKPPGWEE